MSNEKQQKILEMAKDICRYQPCCNDVCKPISACDALRYAERAVEAGYVKVVQCKDCKHSCFVKSCSKYECRKGCGTLKYSNDFCSYGEREGGDEK